MKRERKQALHLVQNAKTVTFLTGAGASVASGIPDYRSMTGVYQGKSQPEYLLSHTCLMKEPDTFYDFVKQLYHPEASPNVIHKKIRVLEQRGKNVAIVTQNIDQLHHKAGSHQLINFHGSLYDCYCLKCGEEVSAQKYLKSDRHQSCGGQLRPGVVLYGEPLPQKVIEASIQAVEQAEVIVIVGTSFQVHPFCDLIHYRNPHSQVIVVNRETITLAVPHLMIEEDATTFFKEL